MKLRDIYKDPITNVFIVTEQNDSNVLNWTIEPTEFELIPEEENYYFVKALQISENQIRPCYMGIMTPERIAEIVVKKSEGKISVEEIHEQENSVIPAIASDCFGAYELFYSKENPQIGIDVLKNGLSKAKNKSIVAEDLGYILRDELQIEEAVKAFKISEENEPSSEYIYLELAELYEQLGQTEKHIEYKQKYKDNGGIL